MVYLAFECQVHQSLLKIPHRGGWVYLAFNGTDKLTFLYSVDLGQTFLRCVLGCSDSSPKTIPSLLYCDSCSVSDSKDYYAPFEAEGFLVLSSLDALSLLGFTSRSRWNSSWLVVLPIWKNCSPALLALCGDHSIFTSFLFICYVFNRNQRTVVYKTWGSN